MITELKLTKIEEETRDSQAIAKQELRNVIKTGCAKSKTTARCLQVVGNLKDEDEPDEYAKLQARGVPKFLIEMQARAWERNQRHQEARDRRDHLERVKEEQRLAAEQAKVNSKLFCELIIVEIVIVFAFSTNKTRKRNDNVSLSCMRNVDRNVF